MLKIKSFNLILAGLIAALWIGSPRCFCKTSELMKWRQTEKQWTIPTPHPSPTPFPSSESSESQQWAYLNLAIQHVHAIKYSILPALRRLYERDPALLSALKKDPHLQLDSYFEELDSQRERFQPVLQGERMVEIEKLLAQMNKRCQKIISNFDRARQEPSAIPLYDYNPLKQCLDAAERFANEELRLLPDPRQKNR